MEQALKLLGHRALTERQLEQALARKGFAREQRDAALARVTELGYIDDAEVAKVRAERLLAKGEAPRLVARRLRAQGIAGGTAQAASLAAASGASEAELVAQALQRRLRGRPIGDARDRQRLFRALLQRGHRAAAVAKALDLEGSEQSEACTDGIDEEG